MTPADLAETLRAIVCDLVADDELDVVVPVVVPVECSKVVDHGDYATPLALQLARSARRPPRDVAEAVAVRLRRDPAVAGVDVAGGGFLNIRLAGGALGKIARTVARAGDDYVRRSAVGPRRPGTSDGHAVFGRSRAGVGGRMSVECVRATPTGPVTVASARQAAVEDALARLLGADRAAGTGCGAAITKSTCDAGTAGAAGSTCDAETMQATGNACDADEAGVQADRFEALVLAAARGLLASADGHRADYAGGIHAGEAAAGGIARTAFRVGPGLRDFSVDDGSANNRSADKALADDGSADNAPADRAFADNAPAVRVGKKFGSISDLVDAVGMDAVRYSLVRTPPGAAGTLDPDVIARRTNDNPVFRVQYTHAWICLLLRNARQLGLGVDVEGADVSLLTHPREGDLLRALGELSRVVETAAELREPYRVARYLEELVGTYHRFHEACRVLPQGDEAAGALTGARLLLADATRIVLAGGLRLLGVSAPTRM
ncbi:DALR anticodon-binding domain-containing protein [Protofrankia symbiont of Coriaria ruscifolia]|uniref:DALR anticodon-binding domain-containing protein n=1 Tax=Protofrankia symbiont of Coriaria ruscifolia TaxID=1306542 RepID=UPI001A945B1F|nr:DALR anticodon-binding domain-containing protein [Protofrankia symbiont of Coriaria ruscifolia]